MLVWDVLVEMLKYALMGNSPPRVGEGCWVIHRLAPLFLFYFRVRRLGTQKWL